MDPSTKRILLQHLDGLLRAGVTQLPVSRGPIASPVVSPPAVSPPVNVARVIPASPAPAVSKPPAPPPPLPAPMPRKLPAIDPPPVSVPQDLPADRVTALAIVNDLVKGCTRCAELAATRTQTVFGVGNPHAKILFIGEAPGADEDRQGEPFVGRAGQKLNDIIRACRLTREEIYICNILRCRPPGNRAPEPHECGNCREYLLAQLKIVDPDYIVCWGGVAATNLLCSDLSIGKMRGKFHQFGRAKVLCTYHPSYLLRNPDAKRDVWNDMKFLFADMGIDLNPKS